MCPTEQSEISGAYKVCMRTSFFFSNWRFEFFFRIGEDLSFF